MLIRLLVPNWILKLLVMDIKHQIVNFLFKLSILACKLISLRKLNGCQLILDQERD